jgi:hypothetical protein
LKRRGSATSVTKGVIQSNGYPHSGSPRALILMHVHSASWPSSRLHRSRTWSRSTDVRRTATVLPALVALALAAPAVANHSAPTGLTVTGKTHDSVSLDWNDYTGYGTRSVNDDYHVRVLNSAGTLVRMVEKDPDPRDGLNESSTVVVTDL